MPWGLTNVAKRLSWHFQTRRQDSQGCPLTPLTNNAARRMEPRFASTALDIEVITVPTLNRVAYPGEILSSPSLLFPTFHCCPTIAQ